MKTGHMVPEPMKPAELASEEPEKEKEPKAIAEEPAAEQSFADLMDPDFIAQFKGCWRW